MTHAADATAQVTQPPAPLDFKAIFDTYIGANQKVWAHDRSQSLGASETFGCLRKAWFSKRGEAFGFKKDPDANQSWGALERGNILENHFVVPALSNHLPEGCDFLFGGDDQQTLFKDRSSATPDGLITGLASNALAVYGIEDIESDCITVEIKSIDPRVSLFEEKAIHHGQTQIQMGLIRETTVWKPMYAVILYIDASFLDNIKVFIVRFEQSKWEAAQRRAATIWAYDDPAKIKPEGFIDGSCDLCPFQNACDRVTVAAVPIERKSYTYTEADRERMRQATARYHASNQAKKKVEREFEEAKEDMKLLLREIDARKMEAADRAWKVSYSTVKGKTTLDVEALKEGVLERIRELSGDDEATFDFSAFYNQGTGYEKLTVTISDDASF